MLIFLVMMMGIGGVVLVGFGQNALKQVEAKRFEHNKRVLEEAKQALLQFAYNYPVTNGRGPGRLPCPDTNDSGTPNSTTYCKFLATGGQVGRFPWDDPRMNFYDARDASGERLWYAVSENFANTPDQVINSGSTGTITLVDQTGNIIFDGNGAGIAAVIIAPGAALAGQDRNTGPDDPANFLDAFNGFDNSLFWNSESNDDHDGFILGPVFDPVQNTNVINDQFIIITAAEVIEMAEKATLQAYRDALQSYDQRIDTDVAAGEHYPWLFNYAVNDYGGGYPELDEYPSDPVFATELTNSLGSNGRIPSIFTNYFTETDGQPIESHLGINLVLTYPISPATVSFNQAFARCPSDPSINCENGVLDFNSAPNHVINQTSTDPLTAVTFEDTNPNVFSANDGRLTATVVAGQVFSDVKYFWDEEPVGNGWEECLDDGDFIPEAEDCQRDVNGFPNPGNGNDKPSQVLRVQVDVNLADVINFDMNYVTAPLVTVVNSADGTQHANITGTFAGTNLDASTLPITVTYEYDHFYDAAFNVQASGSLSLGDLLQGGSLALTMRYYPELPDWAISNLWHDSIQMAYANNLRPDIAGSCIEADALLANRCLTINNMAGNIDNKKSILIIAGQRDWNDDNVAGLADDVGDVFDLENENLDDIFDARATNGNDKILVIDEL
ncbi:MAG: hypothetical protein OEY09_18040 [Gammaproteobacteria bacterium]|nr:hypothetical protein [Gammaproteobacteria bacterium]